MVIKKIKNSKKNIVISLVLLAVIASSLAFIILKRQNDAPPIVGKATADTFNKVDYSPADSTDKTYNNQIKENLTKDTQSETPAGQKQKANITIVDATQYDTNVEVRAFVNNVVENNGTCTLTFTGPGDTVTKTVSASADAAVTRCQNSVIPSSSFNVKGTWQLVISYTSDKSFGQTEKKSIEVK